jgi:ABC-type amino acid transport substrate-binding protein
MKFVKILVAVLGLALMCSSLFAETRTIKMGVFDLDPYVSTEQGSHGLLSEIIVVALKRMEYSVEIDILPFGRIIHGLKSGNIDIAPAISQDDERSSNIDFSSIIFDMEMIFLYKKGRLTCNNILDFKNYTGGVREGSLWLKKIAALGIRYEAVGDQEQNIKKLAGDRIDFICIPKEFAFYLLKKIGEDPNKYDFFIFDTEGQRAGISKKTKFKELYYDFEKGMNIIKNDGTYDNIISKYK